MSVYCISIDPGETTGIIMVPREDTPWNVVPLQLGPEPHHRDLAWLITEYMPKIVICESFENRGKDAAVLASVEYIGIVKLLCGHAIFQSAAIAKGFWDDNKLKRVSMYIPNKKHARDALRHYAYWRTFVLTDQTLLNRLSPTPAG